MDSIFTAIHPGVSVRAVAIDGDGGVLVSMDGTTFVTVLFVSSEMGPGHQRGTVVQPALEIEDVALSFDLYTGEATYDGVTYVLDDTATIGSVVTKPIMRVVELVQTCAGYYVNAQNKIDGKSYYYLDGQRLTVISDMRARGSDFVVNAKFGGGHSYFVRGDHMNTANQAATFDGEPATTLSIEDYEVTFPDDLTVSVTKK